MYLKLNTIILVMYNSENTTLTCYLHNVSEVKNASESKRKYFNCIIQSNKKLVRAVCFSPEKRTELQTLAKTKSPVKMKNYKRSNNDNDDLTITKYTKITPVDKAEVEFVYAEELSSSATGKPVNILSILNLAPEQLILVKGKVLKMSGVKIQTTRFGKLQKQDVIIADSTAHIKLVLWGEYVNTLQLNKTYTLKNVRVKPTRFEHFLNTPKNEDFNAVEATEYTTPVVEYEDEVDTTCMINATILGVKQASKALCCSGCQKRDVEIINPNKAICRSHSCQLQQRPSSCTTHWALRLLLKPDKGSKNILLRLDHNATEALLHVLHPNYQLGLATEDEIVVTLLENYQTSFAFTYDSLTSQVSSICGSKKVD